LLDLHCLFADNAAQEAYQRAFIVVQMMPPRHSHWLMSPLPAVPIGFSTARWPCNLARQHRVRSGLATSLMGTQHEAPAPIGQKA
jgi:hypothetical protein